MGRGDDTAKAIALVLALALLLRRRDTAADLPAKGWAWPLADLVIGGVTVPAVVSNGWRPPHMGVDVMYRRDAFPGDTGLAFPPGSTNGTDNFICPPGTPVVAARDGVVHASGTSSRGHYVVLAHAQVKRRPLFTFYQHLETFRSQLPVIVKPGAQVTAGAILGTAGYDPAGSTTLSHVT